MPSSGLPGPETAALDTLILPTSPFPITSEQTSTLSLRSITSFSSSLLHILPFFGILWHRPPGSVNQSNSTYFNSIVPIHKTAYAPLLLKANTQMDKNSQPNLSAPPAFATDLLEATLSLTHHFPKTPAGPSLFTCNSQVFCPPPAVLSFSCFLNTPCIIQTHIVIESSHQPHWLKPNMS